MNISLIMSLELKRVHFDDTTTLGIMYLNGKWFGPTLEDAVRDGKKVYGKTAIPAGTYEIVVDMSSRFKKLMPRLLNVPGFEGIRIHGGNTHEDTYGCPLIGTRMEEGRIQGSKSPELTNRLLDAQTAGKNIYIEIRECR